MLILSDNGAMALCSNNVANWLITLRAGLFRTGFVPWHGMVLAQLEPSTFSGYVGLRDMLTWGAPVLIGRRATVAHGEILWHHNGGPVAQMVAGYYVVDASDTLIWADLRADGPLLMASALDTYKLTPRFTQRSEFDQGV